MKPLVLFTAFMLSSIASAEWGHLNNLNESWFRSSLIFDVIERQEVRYCLQISDTEKFRPESIALQVEGSLRLWERPLQEIGLPLIRHIQKDCSQEVDLKLEIGPETRFPQYSAYEMTVDGDSPYSRIKINTDYSYSGEQYVDFSKLIPAVSNLNKVMNDVSWLAPMDVMNLAQSWGLPWTRVHFSTYRVLNHELGHSFGMCDTYDAQVEGCDTLNSTETHPSSMMRDANTFYLTEDDRAGIQALYRRFKR